MKKFIFLVLLFLSISFSSYSQPAINCNSDKDTTVLVFSLYNNLAADVLCRPNIGGEVYFEKLSFFIEGSFSNYKFWGNEYDIDAFYLGFRKYFNDKYDKVFVELYSKSVYFDTDIFMNVGKYGYIFGGGGGIGYKITLKYNWKIYPLIRFGVDRIYYKPYYQENGNIDISFDPYINGRTDNGISHEDITSGNNIIYNTRKIDKDFFNTCTKGYWVGPTFIGIVIQKDFYFKK